MSLQEPAPLEQALKKLAEAAKTPILYSRDNLPKEYQVGGNFEKATVGIILQRWLQGTSLVFIGHNKNIIIQSRRSALAISDKPILSGYIRKAQGKESLVGAALYIPALQVAVTSNAQGFYSLSVPKGTYEAVFGALGYETYRELIHVDTALVKNIALVELHAELDSIDIIADRNSTPFQQLELDRLSLRLRDIKDMPAFLGESDPIKALQLYPGMQQSGEGTAGFFVRGGGADQNLILMDDTPIYNASHLLGFFSTFNADAIKEVTLHKGGIPAKYGGRLSSILDIKLREGSYETPHISGGIGSLSSRLTGELPFAKGKGSIIATGRRTYLDLLLQSLPNSNLSRNKLFFYDLNLKATLKPSQKHEISLSAYSGEDNISLQELFGTSWGNQALSLRWNTSISPKLYSRVTGFYTNFSVASEVSLVSRQFGYLLNYDLQDTGMKHDISYYLSPKYLIEGGYSLTRHRYLFGEIKPSSANSLVDPQKLDPAYALEWGAYLSLRQELLPRLNITLGIRYSRFDNVGEASVFLYDRDEVISPETSLDNVVDTAVYGRGERYHHYEGLEPRMAVQWDMTNDDVFRLSYNRTRQYIHRLTNTNTPSPIDMWAPVNQYIPPQIADQFAIGYQRQLDKNSFWELSLEAYYKYMQNQVDFKPQASLFLNNHLETEILLGKGQAYGLEFLLRRKEGRLKGWLSYTWSKTERQIKGINRNEPYPTSFDRRHNLAAVLSYQAGKRVLLSANWVYASGIAYTFPVGKYQVGEFVLPYYTSRNGFRLEPIHRLDLSVTLFREMTQDRKNESSFVFSLYNAYGRKNTYAYVFRQVALNSSRTETVKLYLFSVLPSFSYNFSF